LLLTLYDATRSDTVLVSRSGFNGDFGFTMWRMAFLESGTVCWDRNP
jgi:hypothetical protein